MTIPLTQLLCIPLVFFSIFFPAQLLAGSLAGNAPKQATSAPDQRISYPPMPAPGKEVRIGNDYYFVYGFDKRPKLGTIIMKVEIYTRDGKRDTSLEVMADAGMPSMRGAHETGDRSFQLSKKGDYLLPITIVMPGDWEVRLTIKKDGRTIFRGSCQFDV